MKDLEKRLILTYGNGIKWVIIGGLTGGIVGSVSAHFAKGIQIVSQIRSLHPLLIGLLPFAGILIVFSYRLCSVKEPIWFWNPYKTEKISHPIWPPSLFWQPFSHTFSVLR